MTNKEIIDKIDFTGGKGSSFDFWHLHVDFDGEGNKNWITRKKFLDEHILLFGYLKTKINGYPHPYQIWIGIDENDSSQDGIYIHSLNPNTDYFPHTVNSEFKLNSEPTNLEIYLMQTGLAMINCFNLNSKYYYLYDIEFGVPLN